MNDAAILAVEGTTLTQRAYALLRQDILSGALPAGTKLRIEALKAKYDIGASPLREALSRLAADGFVIAIENRGFRIPPLSLAELRDVTDQRKLIECEALRRAIARTDEDFESSVLAAYYKLSRLDDRLGEGDGELRSEWESRHRNFHRALIDGAESPWLSKFQEILYDQADRYRRLYLPQVQVPQGVKDDHKELLHAVLDRDADHACEILSNHVERVFEIASRAPMFRGEALAEKR